MQGGLASRPQRCVCNSGGFETFEHGREPADAFSIFRVDWFEKFRRMKCAAAGRQEGAPGTKAIFSRIALRAVLRR
jgi:hypothetical protein